MYRYSPPSGHIRAVPPVHHKHTGSIHAPQHHTVWTSHKYCLPPGTSEPYRLYNLDVFEYLDSSPFGLYGAIPMMVAHKVGLTTGVLW